MFEPFSSEPERISEYLKWQEIFNFEGGEFYQNNPILQEHMSDKPLNMRNFLLYHGDYARANKVLTKFGVKALDKIPDRYTISGNKITFNYVTPFFEVRVNPNLYVQTIYEIYQIQFFPDVIKKLIIKGNGRGIFYNGKPTDLAEFAEFRGKKTNYEPYYPFDDCWGICDFGSKTFVAQPHNNIGFHEFAHLSDYFVGKVLFGDFLSENSLVKSDFNKLQGGMLFGDFCETSCEFLARFMEKYFSRDFEKKVLYNKFPHTTRFLDDILDSLVKKY